MYFGRNKKFQINVCHGNQKFEERWKENLQNSDIQPNILSAKRHLKLEYQNSICLPLKHFFSINCIPVVAGKI